ncbi:hypothetical protein AB0L00_26635 [Actinoallomurus sp. NPDC052308]|uniref:hypothetical protein n=1 Tax=Actinoallomurus sp. NPDC052308 TaxID=3155530 RepID=UPI0034367132
MSLISHLYFGELGEWCAERMTGTGEVVQRLTAETKGLPVVRPAGRVGRRHWAQVDRAFGMRMATLVQSAPPYSVLYGLVRGGLASRDWAHRQAGLYPTHIRLGKDERHRALDLRPTFTGWLDLANEHGVDRYVAEDGAARYARFPYSTAETVLDDLFDRMRAYFATYAPFGQVGAEKGLARLCWLLAMFSYVFRNDPVDQPFFGAFRDGVPTVEQLHAAVEEDAVTELVQLVERLHGSGALHEMRRLAGHPPPGRPWGIAWPVFGSQWDDNDILVGGPRGATLIDVTSVLKVNDARRARRWIWRLVGCAWLDTADAYRIRTVALYLARYGVVVAWPLADLVEELLGGEDPERARHEFLDLVARLRGTTPAVSP